MCVKATFVLVFMGLVAVIVEGTPRFITADDDFKQFGADDELDAEQLDALIENLERSNASKNKITKRFSDDGNDFEPQQRSPRFQKAQPGAVDSNCRRWAIC